MYQLPSKPITEKKTYSGTVYRLQVEERDMAIKVYRTEKMYEEEEMDDWFPPYQDMEVFLKASSEVFPFLLSDIIVFDEKDHYIGCGCYFVTETMGNTSNILFDITLNDFFTYIFSLEEKIPVISKYHISLDDLSIGNARLGTISGVPNISKLYMFDDSNYRVSEDSIKEITNDNYTSFSDFIYQLISDYYSAHQYTNREYVFVLKELRRKDNYLKFLEKESRGYSNMNEFLLDYIKTFHKKINSRKL